MDIGRTDDQSLCAAGLQVVDRAQHLVTIGSADLDEFKVVFLRGFVGELPFQLEPWLFRLLDDEPKLQLAGASTAGSGCATLRVVLVASDEQPGEQRET